MSDARPSKRRQARAGVRPPTLRAEMGGADPDGLLSLCRSVSNACDAFFRRRGIEVMTLRDSIRASAVEADRRTTANAVESPVKRDGVTGCEAPVSSVRRVSAEPQHSTDHLRRTA